MHQIHTPARKTLFCDCVANDGPPAVFSPSFKEHFAEAFMELLTQVTVLLHKQIKMSMQEKHAYRAIIFKSMEVVPL
jgi:hypothetical protein